MIKNLPPQLDVALRKKAAEQGQSVEHVVIEVLRGGLEPQARTKFRELGGLAGTWVEDPEFDAAMSDQR